MSVDEAPTDDWLRLPPDPPPIGRSEMARMACNLARNTGWPVFACRADKRPATAHGFKDASTDPNVIARMFEHPEAALVAIATGQASGIDILDIDIKHDAATAWLASAASRIPETRTYRTKSGGVHLYFRHADGVANTQSKVARGVDTRGAGGYAVFWFASGFECIDPAPPAPWPQWLLDVLLRPAVVPPPPVLAGPGRRYAPAGTRPAALIARALERVSGAAEGHRHDELRDASYTLGGLLDAAGLSRAAAEGMLLDAVIAAGGARVDRGNAVSTIRSGLDKGATRPLSMEAR